MGMNKRAASGESVMDPSSDSSPGSPSPRLEQRHHSVQKQNVPAHGSAYPSEVQLQQARSCPPLCCACHMMEAMRPQAATQQMQLHFQFVL
jgi:hypothetical protein